ncbi:hypothetical protein WN943_003707 [Citrus x changshan-huyou]
MAASSSRQFKNICVLSGFHYEKYKEFIQVAVDLGRAIAERKLHLVYGGGDRGLSKLVSEAVFIRGNQVLGIISQALKPLGCRSDVPIGEELVVSTNPSNAFVEDGRIWGVETLETHLQRVVQV